jgi:hypothetical protein
VGETKDAEEKRKLFENNVYEVAVVGKLTIHVLIVVFFGTKIKE